MVENKMLREKCQQATGVWQYGGRIYSHQFVLCSASASSKKLQRLNNEMKSYFKPKKIEFYRDQTIYEFVGIKLYKKYLPMTGDIARKRRNIIQIKLNKSGRINELYRYERQTRNNELRHIIATTLCIGLIFIADKKLSWLDLFSNVSKSLFKHLSYFSSAT